MEDRDDATGEGSLPVAFVEGEWLGPIEERRCSFLKSTSGAPRKECEGHKGVAVGVS